MDLVTRKPDFVAWEQQRRIPDCVFTQSGQRFVIRFLAAIIGTYVACLTGSSVTLVVEWFPIINPKGKFLATGPTWLQGYMYKRFSSSI